MVTSVQDIGDRGAAQRQGRFKVPGGKLVCADLTVDGQVITQASVSGDFFLEPDEALDCLNQALVGTPTSIDAPALHQRLSDALPANVRFGGFDVDAVVMAVRRALGLTSTWDDFTFDVIGPVTLPPAQHVALDEVIAAEVASGVRPPTLRMWDWDAGVVVIGSFQSLRNEVDEEAAARYGIQVVRRITGGGAMFMEPGNCITYSLVVPGSLVDGLTYEASYAFLDQWVLGGLAKVGVQARYVPLNDIASDLGKIGGAAQRRLVGGTVLHHVTMSYDIDADKMTQVLRIGREKLSDKGIASANKRVDPMRSQTKLPRAVIMETFLDHFNQLYNCQRSNYSAEELAQAEQLVRDKYNDDAWTRRVP